MMGTGAFLYAFNFSVHGLAGSGILGPVPAIVYTLFKVIHEVRYRCKNGRWTRPYGSTWLTDERKFRWSSLIPLIGNTGANIGYTVVMTFAWRFATQGGLN